jgi:two-component system sensor histidine kinase KdpD
MVAANRVGGCMSEQVVSERSTMARRGRQSSATDLPVAAHYGLALILVGVAALLAFVVEHLIAAPNLTLIFVLPVVIAATAFGWGPALVAAGAGVLAFDFFFTAPYYSFRIASPSDLWAAALLLVIAAIVSSVAAEARRRALEANRAAEQAQALQALAHVVIEDRPRDEVLRAAGTTLNRLFRAPAVVFLEERGAFGAVAMAGAPNITPAEEEAARGALDAHVATRSETYPYDRSEFDFWPVTTPAGCRCVVGVDFTKAEGGRPTEPERSVDVVRGYLAAAFAAR